MLDLLQLKQLYNQWSYREINNYVMIDTKELCETNHRLIESIEQSVNSCLIVYEEDNIDISPKLWNTQIVVSNKRSYEAAKSYKWKKIAVLDFANNHAPWWAPFSAWAQEESMCRCSTLYSCLIWWNNYNLFYQRHRDLYDHWEIDWRWNDDLMYFHDITVFKSDEDIPQLMDEGERYNVDVIVSAAPQVMRINPDLSVLEPILRKRIKRILDVVYQQKAEVLILWAYGCWAFRNPPKLVAKIFKEELQNYDFEIVEFPIFGRDFYWRTNQEVFSAVFSWNQEVEDNNYATKYDLFRFKSAQEKYFDTAIGEIKNWHKQTHWIRYIFPQIAGLWHSDMAQKYAISSIEEAIEYYKDKELRQNLEMISQALIDLDWNNPEIILWDIDAIKVRSCMTLFHQVDSKNQIFIDVLKKYYHWELDEKTLDILGE